MVTGSRKQAGKTLLIPHFAGAKVKKTMKTATIRLCKALITLKNWVKPFFSSSFAPELNKTPMKRILIFILALNFISRSALKADEGMWLPMLLGEQVYADMVKKGLKL